MPRNFDPAKPELMDRTREVTPAFERDMQNLVSINRQFGGHRLVRRYLEGWMNSGRVYRVLDLCTGVADLPRMMVDWARSHDITLRVDAVDANPAVLSIGRRDCASYPEIQLHESDVLSFTPDDRYDLVHCSLALHHFGDDDSVRLLRNARKWSNRWVLITDLERSPADDGGDLAGDWVIVPGSHYGSRRPIVCAARIFISRVQASGEGGGVAQFWARSIDVVPAGTLAGRTNTRRSSDRSGEHADSSMNRAAGAGVGALSPSTKASSLGTF
jgi:SAM-dependent methyltransferase